MKKKPFLIGNWKMHKTHQEAGALIRALSSLSLDRITLGITPPFTALSSAVDAAGSSSILIGAQTMHAAPQGAFTGEISAGMLCALGVKYVLLGHSERRHLFHETSFDVNQKLKMALSCGLLPVVCIGETLEERERGQTEKVLAQQLQESLSGISLATSRIVIAYEPVWAIGTGEAATPEMAEKNHHACVQILQSLFGSSYATTIELLYGGSVTPQNLRSFLEQPHIHGALIGGASLHLETFQHLIQEASL